MLGNIIRRYFTNTIKISTKNKLKQTYFGTEPITEGLYEVTPSLSVPRNITAPDYVNNPDPQFGEYSGRPVLHDAQAIQNLKNAAKLASQALTYICSEAKEGITTDELDKKIHQFIIDHKAYPTALGFMHFPKSVCTSVNEVLCHGIPDQRPLRNGDFINFDVTLYLDGMHGDNSAMVCIGEVPSEILRLIDVTQEALYESIKICKPGTRFNKIGQICEEIALKNGFHVCELFTGHGVGNLLHMPPMIHHIKNEEPYKMRPGNVFTIEPIFMMKRQHFQLWRDNFTVVSPENPSAQWEHTILITEDGHEVLTKREGEIIPYWGIK